MQLSIFLLSLPLAGAWWVGLQELTNEDARKKCFPGDLASFSTNQELGDLLNTNQDLRRVLTNNSTAYFWVGLEKPKDLCVVQNLVLRGFRWSDGRLDAGLSVWREEPTDTCTNVRCGAVAVDSRGWGLVSQSCKNKNHFICGPSVSGPGSTSGPEGAGGSEGQKRSTGATPEEPEGIGPGGTREPGVTVKPGPNFRPGPEQSPDPPLSPVHYLEPPPGPSSAGLDPGSNPGPHGTTSGSNLGSSPGPGLGSSSTSGSEEIPGGGGPFSQISCGSPVVPGSRSLSLDPEWPELVLVECWSGEELLLLCESGIWTRPGSEATEVPGGSVGPDPLLPRDRDQVLNRSAELRCPSCGPGLQFRDGECKDVDECSFSPGPCGLYRCKNSHGSFMCTPATLVHALIAVATVTVLLAAVVTVWCCIRTRRKQDQKHDQNQTDV